MSQSRVLSNVTNQWQETDTAGNCRTLTPITD